MLKITFFFLKAMKELGTEEIYLNIIKAIYDNTIANIILIGEKLKKKKNPIWNQEWDRPVHYP